MFEHDFRIQQELHKHKKHHETIFHMKRALCRLQLEVTERLQQVGSNKATHRLRTRRIAIADNVTLATTSSAATARTDLGVEADVGSPTIGFGKQRMDKRSINGKKKHQAVENPMNMIRDLMPCHASSTESQGVINLEPLGPIVLSFYKIIDPAIAIYCTVDGSSQVNV